MNRVVLGFVCAAIASYPAHGEDKTATAALAKKGLSRASDYFVIADEAKVTRGLASLQALRGNLVAAMNKQKRFEVEKEESRKLRITLTQERLQISSRLPYVTAVNDHNVLVSRLNQIADQLNLIAQTTENGETARELAAETGRAREEFLQKMIDFRAVVDETTTRYAELAKDPAVASALAALNQSGKVKFKLGPTKAFLNAAATLQKLEKMIQTETIALRNENNVFWVDVVINGKLAKPMVFDTGAGIVLLPAEFATQAGLKPSEGDPVINLSVADGRKVKGRLMTLKSIKVGKFTVSNVECAVLPPEMADAPPLLGGTFLKNFNYKISPDQGRLTLSLISDPAAESKGDGAGSAARKTKGKR